jgi:hypothetical protein
VLGPLETGDDAAATRTVACFRAAELFRSQPVDVGVEVEVAP